MFNEKNIFVVANSVDEYLDLIRRGHSLYYIRLDEKYYEQLYNTLENDNSLLKYYVLVRLLKNTQQFEEIFNIVSEYNDCALKYVILAVMYRISTNNIAKVKEYLQLAIEFNDDYAMYYLGYMYSIEKNYEEAYKYFQMGCEYGNPDCYLEIGNLYYNGDYLEKNQSKALEFYLYATGYEDRTAYYNAGIVYEYYYKSYEEALKHYILAANLNYSKALHKLGKIYHNGTFGVVDYSKAFNYYTQASNLENMDSFFDLGVLYYYGNGCKKNYDMSLECFLKCSEKDDISAIRNIGIIYQNDKNNNKDYQKAIEYFNKAIELGSIHAKHDLAKMYIKGKGVEKDINKARELLNECFECDNINLILESILFSLENDELDLEKVESYLNRIGDYQKDSMKNPLYLYIKGELLYKLYLLNTDLVLKNNYYKESVEVLKQVYEFRNDYIHLPKVINRYGIDFYNENIENDFLIINEAEIKKSIFGKNPSPNNNSYDTWVLRARYILALIDECNEDTKNISFKKALMLDLNNSNIKDSDIYYPNASYILGFRYEYGLNEDIDLNAAKKYYIRAAKRGHVKSAFKAAQILEQEDFIRNKDDILRYYTMALNPKYVNHIRWRPVGWSPNALGPNIGGDVYGFDNQFVDGKKPSIEACLYLNYLSKNPQYPTIYKDLIKMIPDAVKAYSKLISNKFEANALFSSSDLLEYVSDDVLIELLNKYCNDLHTIYAYIYAYKFKIENRDLIFSKSFRSSNEDILKLKEFLRNTNEVDKYKLLLDICINFDEDTKIEKILYEKDDNQLDVLLDYAKKGYEKAILYVYNKNKDISILMIGVNKGFESCKKLYSKYLLEEGHVGLANTYDKDIEKNYVYNFLIYMDPNRIINMFKPLGEKLAILTNVITRIGDINNNANIIKNNINNYFYDIDKSILKKVIQNEDFYLPAAIILLACGDKMALINIGKYYEKININHAIYIYDMGAILSEVNKPFLYNKAILLMNSKKLSEKHAGKKIMKALAKERYILAVDFLRKK